MFEFFLRKTREGKHLAYGFRVTGKPPVTAEGLRVALSFHGRQWNSLKEAAEEIFQAGFGLVIQ
ncbi:MAG: hypothetical protein QXT73_02305 [Candidatus Methanomethylicaceae archaeon]